MRRLLPVLAAVLVTLGALALWEVVAWPYSNPAGIEGAASAAGVHPTTHLLRVLLVAVAGGVAWRLLGGPHDAGPADDRPAPRAWTAVLLLSGLWGLARIGAFLSDPVPLGPLDLLHEGEQLAPAWVTWTTGKLWTGSFLVHGLVRDDLGVLAIWALDGEPSVGAVRLFNGGMRVAAKLAWVGFALACGWRVGRGAAGASLAATLWAAYAVAEEAGLAYLDAREAPALLALTALVLARGPAGWATVGLLGLGAGLYSVERGVFVGLTAAGLALLQAGDRGRSFAALVAGVAGGLLGVAALAGPSELGQGVTDLVFLARHKDFIDAMPYPSPGTGAAWATTWPLLALAAMWMAAAGTRGAGGAPRVALVLALAATCFYRYAITAPDPQHLHNARPLVIAGLAGLAWRGLATLRPGRLAVLAVALTGGAWATTAHMASLGRLPAAVVGTPDAIRAGLDRPDVDFLSPEAVAALPVIQEALVDEPCTFVFPAEPAWYFLVRGRPCTRHLMRTLLAPEDLQRETLAAVEQSGIEHLLFASPHPDLKGGRTVDQRLPVLYHGLRSGSRPVSMTEGWSVHARTRQP